MNKEVKLFTKPEELLAWLSQTDSPVNMSVEDAQILLNYMEGHDYALGTDSGGNLARKDIAEENGEIEKYSIEEVIDVVCEWNYELILDADMRRNNPKDFIDFENCQSRYERLKAEEQKLDALFERTDRGRELAELAERFANEVIEKMNQENGVLEAVQKYHMDNRGR